MGKKPTMRAAQARKGRASIAVSPQQNELWPSVGFRSHFAVVFVLGVVVFLTFSNTLHNTGFALDNKFIIQEDPRLRDPCAGTVIQDSEQRAKCKRGNRENIRLIFHEDYWWPKAVSGLYRPLTTLSYRMNYTWLGNASHAAGYHWVNFFVHWLNAILVYFMALVLLKAIWPALFIGALFATHPIVTESVTNMVGRADLFATAAIVGGFLCYVKSTTADGWRKVPWLAALMVVTTVGEFCKESAVAVLGVMALYDFIYRMERKHPNWLANLVVNFREFAIKGYVALIPPFVALWWVRSSVFEKLRPPELPFVDNPLIGSDFWTARMTAIKVIGKYFWLLAWPRTLSCDYSYDQIPMVTWRFNTWENLKALIALASVIVVIVVAIRNYRRNRALPFFILLFFGTFLPTSNLLVIIGSIMAERFMYLPSIGFAGCVVIAIFALCRRILPQPAIDNRSRLTSPQMVACSALGLVVLIYGVRAYNRNFDWEDDVRLWTQAVQACPDSFKSHKSLAYALYERDQQKNPPDFSDIDRIIGEGEKARAVIDRKPLPPLYRTSIVNLHLGAYCRIKGDLLMQSNPDAARHWYQKSVEALKDAVVADRAFNEDNRKKELARGRVPDQIQDVGNQEVYANLGMSYMRLGQYQDALNAYLSMRHLAPTNPDAYLNIASIYLSGGHAEEAAVFLVQALLIDSGREEALRALADIYRQIDPNGCAVIMSEGKPRLNADCAIVHNHLCSSSYGLAAVFIEAKQFDLARQMEQTAVRNYHCPAELFQQLMPNQSTITSTKP